MDSGHLDTSGLLISHATEFKSIPAAPAVYTRVSVNTVTQVCILTTTKMPPMNCVEHDKNQVSSRVFEKKKKHFVFNSIIANEVSHSEVKSQQSSPPNITRLFFLEYKYLHCAVYGKLAWATEKQTQYDTRTPVYAGLFHQPIFLTPDV